MGWTGGEVGLAISQASMLMGLVNFAMRLSASVQTQLMSVERALEYNSLPREPQPENPTEPAKIWPNKGEIQMEGLCLRYHEEGPLILKNLTLTINPKEKVNFITIETIPDIMLVFVKIINRRINTQ